MYRQGLRDPITQLLGWALFIGRSRNRLISLQRDLGYFHWYWLHSITSQVLYSDINEQSLVTCLWGLEVQKHDYYLPKIYIVSDMKTEEFLSGTILGCICLSRECFVWRNMKFMMVHFLNTILRCMGCTHAHIPLHHLKAQRAAWCYSSVSSEDRSEDMTPSLRRQETSYELSLGGLSPHLCPSGIAQGQQNP